MPELPEVERTRRSLEPALVGARVTSVRVRRADVVVLPGEPAGGWARSRMRPDPDRVVLPGLLLGDCTIRALERLTGQTRGYRHSDPAPVREEAIERWVLWWRTASVNSNGALTGAGGARGGFEG